MPRVARLGLALLLLAASAAGAELVLRALEPDAPRPWPPGLVQVLRPDPELLPGVSGPSVFRVSSLGLRADELPAGSRARVLCIGGSTTECLYLDQEEAWPQRVQAALAAARPALEPWVANAGVSGRTTRDHVVQLRHLLPALPRLDRVVVLAGVNDLGTRLARGDAYDPRFLEREGAERALLPRAFHVLPRHLAPPRPFPRGTALWTHLAPLARRALGSAELVQDETGSVYARWRAHRRSASRVLDELPDLGPALEEYRRNLHSIVALVREAGAEPLLLTQPRLWRAGMPPEEEALLWLGGTGDFQDEPGAAYYSPGALDRGLARYDATLLEVASELGVDALDLASLVPADAAYFYDDVHFTERGAVRVAGLVAERLLEAPPFAPGAE